MPYPRYGKIAAMADGESEFIPAGVVTVSDGLASAPLWRREPFRLFFPVGILLAWGGVAHWLLHALGLLESYRPVFHAITQIQGFMMCFAVGFLFTMIPRRTGSAAPAAWQVVVCLAAPIITSLAAWCEHWLISQAAWLALAVTMIGFAVSRFLSATSRRRPPNSFVWIPASLLMGIAGSLMAGAYGVLGIEHAWLHGLGLLLVLQGLFVGFVLGVGGLAIPLMTRGEAPPDGESTASDYRARAGHIAGVAVLVASFVIETRVSQQAGLLLRGLDVLVVLLLGARIWKAPSEPGWNRRLIWIAAWMLPAGYFLAAAFPEEHEAGLHVVFLGGFAMLALAVSTQVVLGHGGHREQMLGRPWQVPAMGGLIVAAMLARALVDFDRPHFFAWLGLAAALFLASTLVWALFLVPKMLTRPDTPPA